MSRRPQHASPCTPNKDEELQPLTCVEHRLDLLIGPVREVRERPAAVGQHLVVGGGGEQLREHGERGRHDAPRGLGLAAAQVGERPGGVAQHRQLGVSAEKLEERGEGALREYEVAALGRVAGDVAQRPHRLRRRRGAAEKRGGGGAERRRRRRGGDAEETAQRERGGGASGVGSVRQCARRWDAL